MTSAAYRYVLLLTPQALRVCPSCVPPCDQDVLTTLCRARTAAHVGLGPVPFQNLAPNVKVINMYGTTETQRAVR